MLFSISRGPRSRSCVDTEQVKAHGQGPVVEAPWSMPHGGGPMVEALAATSPSLTGSAHSEKTSSPSHQTRPPGAEGRRPPSHWIVTRGSPGAGLLQDGNASRAFGPFCPISPPSACHVQSSGCFICLRFASPARAHIPEGGCAVLLCYAPGLTLEGRPRHTSARPTGEW